MQWDHISVHIQLVVTPTSKIIFLLANQQCKWSLLTVTVMEKIGRELTPSLGLLTIKTWQMTYNSYLLKAPNYFMDV